MDADSDSNCDSPLQVGAAYETVKGVVMGEAEELEKKADAQKGRSNSA